MATVKTAFIARNRRFEIGESVPDRDPLVLEHPALFGIRPAPKVPKKGRTAEDLKTDEAIPAVEGDD